MYSVIETSTTLVAQTWWSVPDDEAISEQNTTMTESDLQTTRSTDTQTTAVAVLTGSE